MSWSLTFSLKKFWRELFPSPDRDFERLIKAADKGEVKAQHTLGTMYEAGIKVPEDFTEAAKWYRMAANRGAVEAQYSLAVMYEFGRGVAIDYSEAAKWYRQAAEQAD